MKAKQRKRALWASIAGLLIIAAAVTSLLVMASGNDITFTASTYYDVIRFAADGVGSLQIRIYDMAENELWDSGQVWMDFVDWDRSNEWGERLANGYYIYFVQGWSTADEVILAKTGRVVLLPGDQVQLQSAPVVASPPTQDEEWPEEPVFSPMMQIINDDLTVNGTITSQESGGVSNFLKVYAGGTGNRAAFTLYGYNASNFGDYATFTMRTDLADAVFSIYDNSATTWHPAYSFKYLQNRFDFKGNQVDNIGQLGIGTTSPSSTLHVVGTGQFTGALTIGSYTLPTADGTSGQVLATNGGGTVSWTTVAGGGSGYWTASGNDIYKNNSGNVGIGDTTPGQKLEVGGNIALSGYLYQGSSRFLHNYGTDNTFLGIDAGNFAVSGRENVGVGTNVLSGLTTANWNTGVGFNALLSNQTGESNVAFGSEALKNCNSGGNSAFGVDALELLTGVDNLSNTALGYDALDQLTSGSYNIGIGQHAGTSLTSGSFNIYIGNNGQSSESNTIRIGNSIDHTAAYLAGVRGVSVTGGEYVVVDANGQLGSTASACGGYWTATGDDISNNNSGNVGVGIASPPVKLAIAGYTTIPADKAYCMHNPSDVDDFMPVLHLIGGTAVGGNCLTANTTGYQNVAVGGSALSNNTEGNLNTAVGAEAQSGNTTGSANTAVGYKALYSNQTGDENTAVGHFALYDNTAGEGNTAVGEHSLRQLDSGDNNIALGQGAGWSLTDGSDNIYIGSAGPPSSGAESSTIRIGDNEALTRAFVGGINGVTVSGGTAVYIKSDGQLGTTPSSARFKTGIADLGSASDVLYNLRPVMFRYRPELDPVGLTQYGLIAEEVAEVSPDLVIYEDNGEPYTVRYEQLVPLLLNELQKQQSEIDELLARLGELEQEMATLK